MTEQPLTPSPSSDPYEADLRWVLDRELTREDLTQAVAIHQRVQQDTDFSEALRQCDALRQTLGDHADVGETQPAGGYPAMRQRLAQNVQTATVNGTQGPCVTEDPACDLLIRRRHRDWIVPAITAAAAAVITLVFTMGWQAPTQNGTPQAASSQTVERLAAHDGRLPADPAAKRAALRELWDFFDGHAGWVAVTGSDIRVGLTDETVALEDPIVVRLSLTSPTGETVNTDVALMAGQQVEIPPAPGTADLGAHYRLRLTTTTTSGQAVIQITARTPGGSTLSTALPLAGQPVREVGRLFTDRGDYRIHLGLASGPELILPTPAEDAAG
ncbi:MAG: hypothetical protein AAF750_08855 [Planctomycetota bacterium]